MKKMIVLVLVLVLFQISISYSSEDIKLKLPKGSTGEVYRAAAGHNFYTVVKVNGRERILFANQYNLETWIYPAGTMSNRDHLEQNIKNGDVKKLRGKSKDKVPDEINIKTDGTVEVISWQ